MKPTIVLFSDFGMDSGLVASMHGVCKQVDPTLEIYDATHLLPAFAIRDASFCLQYTVPYWPAGTIFVCVVDPGVGTSRKASVAKLKNGSYVVTPDNGTLTYLENRIGIEEIRQIDEEVNRYKGLEDVSVFHGRDLFAYCAAKLAAGVISYQEVGPGYSLSEMVRHRIYHPEIRDGYAKGIIESHDPFGTVETNFSNQEFVKTGFKMGELLQVTVSFEGDILFHSPVLYESTFGCVKKGEPILFNDLSFYLSLGLNMVNFWETFQLEEGKQYSIVIQRVGG